MLYDPIFFQHSLVTLLAPPSTGATQLSFRILWTWVCADFSREPSSFFFGFRWFMFIVRHFAFILGPFPFHTLALLNLFYL